MNEIITHPGQVIRVLPDALEISILSQSACEGCRVRKQCGMGESREKTMQVETIEAPYFEEGETVEVITEQFMGIKAVLLAYALPFVCVMAVLLTLLQTGCGELVSGLSALGTLALYYIVLYLFRNRIEKEITFKVRKIS